MNSNLRPLNTSEVLDRTFHLYRNNFLLFSGIASFSATIALVMHMAGMAFGISLSRASGTRLSNFLSWYMLELLILFVAYVIGGGLGGGATAHAVYQVHLERTTSIRESFGRVFRVSGKVIAVILLVMMFSLVAVTITAIALIIVVAIPIGISGVTVSGNPAFGLLIGFTVLLAAIVLWIYVSARFSLSVAAVLLEKTSIIGALKRSNFLAKGSVRRIGFVILLTIILSLVFSYVLNIPAYYIRGHKGRANMVSELWGYFAGFTSTVIVGPIGSIAIALIYINQRVMKEAFDLQIMMEAVEQHNLKPQADQQPAGPPVESPEIADKPVDAGTIS